MLLIRLISLISWRADEYLRIIGKCLGAAVGTKNRNDDADEYEEKMIKPSRKIDSFLETY